VSLIVIVVRVLTNDDDFHIVQGGVSGPGYLSIRDRYDRLETGLPRIDILLRRKDLDVGILLLLEKAL